MQTKHTKLWITFLIFSFSSFFFLFLQQTAFARDDTSDTTTPTAVPTNPPQPITQAPTAAPTNPPQPTTPPVQQTYQPVEDLSYPGMGGFTVQLKVGTVDNGLAPTINPQTNNSQPQNTPTPTTNTTQTRNNFKKLSTTPKLTPTNHPSSTPSATLKPIKTKNPRAHTDPFSFARTIYNWISNLFKHKQHKSS